MRIVTSKGGAGLLYRELRSLFDQPLPGVESQVQLAPAGRVKDIFKTPLNRQPVCSGVLLLLYLRKGVLTLCFIRRPEYPGIHSGQMAFPGGRCEDCDRDSMDTALRETEEETGVARDQCRILGKLTPLYIPPSNYMVYPYVALVNDDPVFTPDPAEVAGIVEVPLRDLLKPDIVKLIPPSESFGFLEVPAYVCNGSVIWGATAMITAEWVEMVRRHGPEKLPGF